MAVTPKLFERSVQQGFEKFTETLVGELERFRNEMGSEVSGLRSEMKDLRVEFHQSLADIHKTLRTQLLQFITILLAMTTVAVAIIKLFPNAG